MSKLMKASEVIAQLTELMERYGNQEVTVIAESGYDDFSTCYNLTIEKDDESDDFLIRADL